MNKKQNILMSIAVWAMLIFFVFFLVFVFTTAVEACEAPEMDYLSLMQQAVYSGDYDYGMWCESQRNEKIDELCLTYPKVSFDELWWLSKIIWCEAGSDGICYDWRCSVGAVVINRSNDERFAEGVVPCIFQKGQYTPAGSGQICSACPTLECITAASDCLTGAFTLPPDVVFQAEFFQGSYVYKSYVSPWGSVTYFCGG